jgi:Asp-tRNA(Asn)/Glu-tRNA(Gln) amidotransferase C subunit
LPTADELFEKYKKERESNFAKTEFTEKEVDMISTELKNILEFREEKADFNN